MSNLMLHAVAVALVATAGCVSGDRSIEARRAIDVSSSEEKSRVDAIRSLLSDQSGTSVSSVRPGILAEQLWGWSRWTLKVTPMPGSARIVEIIAETDVVPVLKSQAHIDPAEFPVVSETASRLLRALESNQLEPGSSLVHCADLFGWRSLTYDGGDLVLDMVQVTPDQPRIFIQLHFGPADQDPGRQALSKIRVWYRRNG